MKICYLCPDLGIPLGGRKGAAAHVRGLVGALRDAGHDLVVVSAAPADDAGLGVPVAEVPTSLVAEGLAEAGNARLGRALRHLLTNVSVERTLVETLRGQAPDLVYERYGPFGVAGGIVARSLGLPHVLEVNAPLAQEGARYRRQALPDVAATLERRAFAAAQRIVAVSAVLRDEIVGAGVDPAKIAVVPNGVDLALFRADGPRACEELAGRFVLGFVGSLRPWHGIEVLLRAFRELASEPRFHLLVVGDGPLASQVAALGRELPARVTFVRGVDHAQVPACLRAMDAALAPYPPLDRFYFSPLKLLEYMATGRAIVASAIGQIDELIRHEETGLLVPPGDAGALACAVRRLAASDELRWRLGTRAAAVARREHGWSQRAERILALAPLRDPHRMAAST